MYVRFRLLRLTKSDHKLVKGWSGDHSAAGNNDCRFIYEYNAHQWAFVRRLHLYFGQAIQTMDLAVYFLPSNTHQLL